MNWNGKGLGRESSKEAAAVTEEKEYLSKLEQELWRRRKADKLKGVKVELSR